MECRGRGAKLSYAKSLCIRVSLDVDPSIRSKRLQPGCDMEPALGCPDAGNIGYPFLLRPVRTRSAGAMSDVALTSHTWPGRRHFEPVAIVRFGQNP